ncbi:oxygen-independent coproporphyrinogen III oxidase [Clostridium sp. P21]|uniref:Heme chaperone HemW n=1 Tax=Clostridium muellerianum TaxID=2716538 RepID=A0A7Y0EEL8_9CLOT|nr:radical SAM family heme chaperone HemW [Clostridium muellerianum]NMM61956.1 oxygen-independent coproporphyrinogen III oxidase [Clostridium muellerianum]
MIKNKNICKSKEIALYIHIPFCKQKCLYCDFPSFASKENLMIDYSRALAKDIEYYSERTIKTIFIGGGTPTYLSLEAWDNISKAINKLNKAHDLEFTVEGNPGTFTEEKLKFLKEMGVNRLSIGLQAWQNNILKKLGRIHTADDFVKSYKMARNVGFKNINVDLMFGLPDQSKENWKETLDKVIGLNPEHISCYSLIIEEGTPFNSMYEKEKLILPEEELERKMYNYGIKFLKSRGYEQYEISNFSKPGKECRHNLIYWNLEEYVGCGSGAHSYIDDLRYRKNENIEEYIKTVEENNNLKLDEHINSIEDNMEEFMFMGLRKISGISIMEFKRRFGEDIFNVYGGIIKKYTDNGIIIHKDDNLFLSERGIEVSNSVMCDFILT